jgi:hypothetical protein
MVDDAIKRVFALSRQDIYFMIIILMLGVQMAFNFSLIEPIRDIQERIEHDQRVEIAKVIKEIRDSHNASLRDAANAVLGNFSLPSAEGAVCSVACLPYNYTQSEQKLLQTLNRTSLPFD